MVVATGVCEDESEHLQNEGGVGSDEREPVHPIGAALAFPVVVEFVCAATGSTRQRVQGVCD